MTKVFIVGILGKMGQMLKDCSANFSDIEIVGGFDVIADAQSNVFCDVNKVTVPYDVLIDFSRPESLGTVIELSRKFPRPAVLCTTGYDEKQRAEIDKLSTEIPVFLSGNMSVGINVLLSAAKLVTKALGMSADIEIIEKHHNQKVDSPSGTALMIADAVKSVTDGGLDYVYGREGNVGKRSKKELGIHAVRGGSIVGEHELLFCMDDEVISIKHTATSRKVFANGALRAANFLIGKPPKKYDMSDMLSD